ncbi:DUF1489 family protein [Azospirillum halopraeferens]|uniref:DUF1489 family protein n=1 Tax=Azospirillum halopraeferens TaxID=34010 RepID=UPI000416234C|nr:DUF1489 domain-containing protein [Azospirillum halopraeferens]
MPLHLIKLAVGVEDADHLASLQDRRIRDHDGRPAVPLTTRRLPRRAEEILAGGSLYWVVRGSVAVRQRVLAIDTAVDEDGQGFCILMLDPARVPTVPTAHRPFQGWRYLDPAKAPPDLAAAGAAGDELPPHLQAELRDLGLL